MRTQIVASSPGSSTPFPLPLPSVTVRVTPPPPAAIPLLTEDIQGRATTIQNHHLARRLDDLGDHQHINILRHRMPSIVTQRDQQSRGREVARARREPDAHAGGNIHSGARLDPRDGSVAGQDMRSRIFARQRHPNGLHNGSARVVNANRQRQILLRSEAQLVLRRKRQNHGRLPAHTRANETELMPGAISHQRQTAFLIRVDFLYGQKTASAPRPDRSGAKRRRRESLSRASRSLDLQRKYDLLLIGSNVAPWL